MYDAAERLVTAVQFLTTCLMLLLMLGMLLIALGLGREEIRDFLSDFRDWYAKWKFERKHGDPDPEIVAEFLTPNEMREMLEYAEKDVAFTLNLCEVMKRKYPTIYDEVVDDHQFDPSKENTYAAH